MIVGAVDPPRDEGELLDRALAIEGTSVGELAARLSMSMAGGGARTKGKAGALVELALGATGGSAKIHDFPGLGVELKTIPVDEKGRPRESTFVCAIDLADADRATWETSWARRKLSRVLWVPIVTPPAGTAAEDRRIGAPMLWSPSAAQEDVLRRDFDDVMGLIGIGRVDALDARIGRWLQARPKAANGRVRTRACGPDEEPTLALPRGFYLRVRFTGAILREPSATPM